eukprot:scaffold2926_cov242-Chaetoceros_neogracile.AAC.4
MALEASAKFEVIVVDEAAQSVEPATLVALQLGRTTKYDRGIFQRLEEAGHEVHLLDTHIECIRRYSYFQEIFSMVVILRTAQMR